MMPIGQAISMVRCGRRWSMAGPGTPLRRECRAPRLPPPRYVQTKLLDLPTAGRCLLPDIPLNGHLERTAILPRMQRAFHTFLFWLLIAALPLQGFSAALQASCGTGAPHAAADSAAPAQPSVHDAHDAHDASTSHHGQHGDAGDTVAGHGQSSCSACAACCTGAIAPPSAFPASMACNDARPAVSVPAPLLAGFIPPGLERPPKRVTA